MSAKRTSKTPAKSDDPRRARRAAPARSRKPKPAPVVETVHAEPETPAFTVCIATRSDPELEGTVEHLKHLRVPHVMIVSDTGARGPQFCRDHLLRTAKTDICIIIDGHMRFRPETLPELARHVAANPTHIAQARCYHCAPYWSAAGPYCGAVQVERSAEGGGQFWPLPCKWRDESTPGPVSALMGACYAVSRNWYLDGLRAPCQLGTGWGYDEEVLSSLTWVCGGEIHLLPVDCAHLYQAQSTYIPASGEALGIWANRLRLLNLLPMPDAERADLRAWLDNTHILRAHRADIERLAVVDDARREYYAHHAARYAWWRRTWVGPARVDAEANAKRSLTRMGVPIPPGQTAQAVRAAMQGSIPPSAPAELPAEVEAADPGHVKPTEKPNRCPRCQSTAATVKAKWLARFPDRTTRRRICRDCGQTYATTELL